jgi:ankyrin repeat protein
MAEYFEAIKRGDINTIKQITEQEPDIVNQTDEYFDTPLLLAAYKGKVDITKYLVENGANIHYHNGSDGNTALHNAALGDNIKNALEIIIYLVSQGAGLNEPGEMSLRSPLDYINEELFYNTPEMNTFNSIDDIKRFYHEMVIQKWKTGVWKIKRNNRVLKNNRFLVKNIQLPSDVSKRNFPPNVLEKIARLTVFGKISKLNSVNRDITFLLKK